MRKERPDAIIRNGEAVARRTVPVLKLPDFRRVVIDGVLAGDRLAALFGEPGNDEGNSLWAVLANAPEQTLRLYSSEPVTRAYPALTPDCTPAWNFERELAEQWGVIPDDHPWLKPLRFHSSYRRGHDAWRRAASDRIAPAVTHFFRVTGEEVHDVAVGPVHAGIIEPGHFRFQCHGELVLHLEIALGYQHRGIERALLRGPDRRTPHYVETAFPLCNKSFNLSYCGHDL